MPLTNAREEPSQMTPTPDNAAPDPQRTVSELQRQLDEVRAQLAVRNSAYSERITYQAAANDVLKVMSASPHDPQPVFDLISVRARDICDAYGVTVYEYDGALLHWRSATGVSEDPAVREASKAVYPTPPTRHRLPGRAILDRAIVHVRDHDADAELHRVSLTVKSSVVVPLMRGNLPIGALHMGSRERGGFSDAQVGLLKTFADQAVIAIENARLFNEVQAKTHDLEEALTYQTGSANILKVIASSPTDVGPVLTAIVESASVICEAEEAHVALKDGDELVFQVQRGSTPVVWKRRPANRRWVTGRAVVDRKPVHVHDLLSPEGEEFPDGLELALRDGTRTMLSVPLLREGECIGVIALRRMEVRPFSEKQIELLQTFADQAVIAIENARLFNEVQAKTRDVEEALRYQTGSANILNVIASSPTDVQPVLKAIVESACELCEAHDAVVLLKDGNDLCFSAHNGPIPINTDRWPIGRGWASGRAVVDRKTVHVHDIYAEDDFTDGRELSRRAGSTAVRSILAAPLLREGESIGAILLRRQEVRPFNDKQIAMLQTFADQAVIAISNVELFEEVQARTRDLQESLQQQTATSEVLKVISSSPGDLKPVFSSMLENAVNICDAKFGNLFLADGDTARWEAGVGTPPKLAEFFTQSTWFRPTPGSHLDRVLRTKQVSQTTDDTAETVIGASARLGGARSTVCVPMVKDDSLVGAIVIYRTEVRPFTDKQIDLVKNFAAQAVIAIENARLLKELRQRTDDLSASLDDLRAAQDRLVQTEKLASLGQLTAGIAHEIKNPLNFVNNFSALSVELTDELNDLLKQAALAERLRKEVDELTGLLKDNLSKVVQHGKRADSIVKNMLLHSREGSGELRAADINGLVEESLNLAYHGARAEKSGFNITLQRQFDASAGAAELFPQEITRALLNLISNGFYAATKRKTENGEAGFEPTLSATTKNLGASVEIRIRDNGTGIPPEAKEKIFNPFFTTKPAGEGTGLGLSMSHDIIVKQHGGTIDVLTEPGAFTEFIVTLQRKGLAQKKPGDMK
jgi:GAF domain-containing protein